MNQSRLESVIETGINIASGFIISMLVWEFIIGPYLDIETHISETITITLIYTVISIVRGYFWRRFFNNGVHKAVRNFVQKKLAIFI